MKDPDIQRIIKALRDKETLTRDRLRHSGYWEPWQQGLFQVEDGVLYKFEVPKKLQMRQLRVRVVPEKLRRIVFSGCHASPLASYVGVEKTFWRIAVRFWWPGFVYQIRQWVLSCAHCRLANSQDHTASSWLHGLAADSVFDIVFLDIYNPGCVPSKYGDTKVLALMEDLAGFADTTTLQRVTSMKVAHAAFTRFFVTNGLPRLVVVDDGSKFKGAILGMCRLLMIPCEMVSPQNHRAIRVERFFRFVNKLERITVANLQSFLAWAQGITFATYAWNAMPVEGMDLVRSFVAKGRVFAFPIDLALQSPASTTAAGTPEGQHALKYVETMGPVLAKQQEVLRVANNVRREERLQWANRLCKPRKFLPGDIVIVRRQVQTRQEDGFVVKQVFRPT